MPDADAETTNAGTTDADYRWKWLSTVFVVVYGLGFPAWVAASSIAGYDIAVSGMLMSVLTLGWLGTIVYAVGPENVKAAKSLRGE
jgi:hypothetical protein